MADPQKKSEAEAVADLVKANVAPQMIGVQRGDEGVASALLVPQGMTVQSVKKFVDEYLPNPERRQGEAHFEELSSFIAHANRFKEEHSAVFAKPSPTEPKLTSVIDYHVGGPDENREKARHGTHRGVYHFPLDEAWKAWRALDGKALSQAGFAQFVEDRVLDIADPERAGAGAKLFAMNTGLAFASPSQMMALSRGLAVTADHRVASSVNLSSGEGQIVFEETHRDEKGAPLKVPGALLVEIPVFRGGVAYQIPIRLRYRVKDGSVTWSLSTYRPERYFDDAFLEACTRVREETALPLFVGSPEV